MSASLVGSEMCIRDRDSCWACAAAGPLEVQLSCALLVGIAHYFSRCVVAVSYTHLTLPTICSV
eukprot:8337139-Alexandrium_andersonii.AAC.1